MAEPISLVSGVLPLAIVAHESGLTLYNTIQGFKTQPKRVRDLIEELRALIIILESLRATMSSDTGVDFSALSSLLQRCSSACNGFLQELQRCCLQYGGDRQSFRDWARLSYMGDNIDDFKDSLATYKSTIVIVLTDMQLRKSSDALKYRGNYKDHIKTAYNDLEARLEAIDKKLKSLVERTTSDSTTTELQNIKEERSSTQKYLLICGQLSKVINQLQPPLAKDLPQVPDDIPERITSYGIEECRVSMEQTGARLENHMQNILDRMMSKSSATMTREDIKYLSGLREEWITARQCRDICLQADQHLKENIKVIDNHVEGNESVQLLVSNSQTTAYGKNRGYGDQTKIFGYISDHAIRKVTGDFLQRSIQKPSEGLSSTHLDTSSISDEARKFKADSGAYNQLRTSSSNIVLPLEESTNTGTRPTDMNKSATATAYRLLWTCSCGHQDYDDFVETVPGSVTKLAEFLQANGVQSQLIMRPTDSGFFRLLHSYLMLRNTVVSLIKIATTFLHYTSMQSTTHPSTSTPTGLPGQASSCDTTQGGQQTERSVSAVPTVGYQLSNPSGFTQTAAAQHQHSSTDSQHDYMLLCSDESGWLTTREELNVSQIRSDKELFDSFESILRSRKCWARRFASLKTIQRISFVKFALRQNQEVDQLQLGQIPPPEETHYEFHERVPGYIPPIGNRYFMHRFSNSAHCRDSTYCLHQIPKRKHGRPRYGFAPDNSTAWGLYFHESFDMSRLCLCGMVAILLSLVFGIMWAAGKRSIDDGFAVASYILALQVLTVGTVQVGIGMSWV